VSPIARSREETSFWRGETSLSRGGRLEALQGEETILGGAGCERRAVRLQAGGQLLGPLEREALLFTNPEPPVEGLHRGEGLEEPLPRGDPSLDLPFLALRLLGALAMAPLHVHEEGRIG
jgi:hypothetical protein